jgi:hypothetical protein
MSDSRYIDLISSYCDSWCERCAFTDRCAMFETQCAMAMCDSAAEAVTVVMSRPTRGADPADDEDDDEEVARPSLPELDRQAPTAEESRSLQRGRDEREQRVARTTIMQLAHAYTMLAHRWLRLERPASGDPIVAEALEVLGRDHFLITAKLHRALSGRERQVLDDELEERSAQTDFNGSAKVALISIDRSEAAWRAVIGVAAGESPAIFAEQLAHLRGKVEAEFPNARSFVRPGFDEHAPRERRPGTPDP